jgi:hypothetical protein
MCRIASGDCFAVLERVQTGANKGVKSTIGSKYFSSVSTTPAVVFPVLLKLAQHHIAKSDWEFKVKQDIEETLAGVDEFSGIFEPGRAGECSCLGITISEERFSRRKG